MMQTRPYGGLGCLKQKDDHRDFKLSIPVLAPKDIDPTIDLRPAFQPVYDQGQEGACTGHGGAGIVDYEIKKANYPWKFAASRSFIYYNARIPEGNTATDAGASVRDMLAGIAKYGVCPESEGDGTQPDWLFPYIVGGFATQPPDACYKDSVLHTALKYEAVQQDDATFATLLAQGTPIVMGFNVPSSFESSEMASTGIMEMPGLFDQYIGGHCVDIVGRLANHPAGNQSITDWYIMRNSWGSSWGMDGYFLMPAKFLLSQQCSDFWAITEIGFSKPAT